MRHAGSGDKLRQSTTSKTASLQQGHAARFGTQPNSSRPPDTAHRNHPHFVGQAAPELSLINTPSLSCIQTFARSGRPLMLGANIRSHAVEFRVWAPKAQQLSVQLNGSTRIDL